MRVVTARDYDQMSRKASYIVASRVILNPRCVLGLATGDTPKGLYRELVRLHQAGDVDFSGVTTFNLDEYVGLAPEHPNSYHRYMEEHFFRFVSIPPEQRHIPRGDAPDIAAECERYEEAVRRAGGVDLQILGLGRDGHIGFNEPDVKFEKGTHVVRLAPSTIEANARFFASAGEVPQSAISMGIKTIMSARRLLLLASGPEKAEAIRGAVLGAVTPDLPASVLQLHPNATVIVDDDAASLLF
ncbi:glucosamine-6-phosphate deaminase [Aminiphilus circumscriptus]|uniref:glucosamine-6-phosphate deaminase n=1 Tax=Aminiphilus circumscriptus TaxID=290732 RepID=UPI000478556C|nr:glucosamine-6-phosphate deaminase [Aminiphilus circumscriptus]